MCTDRPCVCTDHVSAVLTMCRLYRPCVCTDHVSSVPTMYLYPPCVCSHHVSAVPTMCLYIPWALSCTQHNLLSTLTHVSLLVSTQRKADFPPQQTGATRLAPGEACRQKAEVCSDAKDTYCYFSDLKQIPESKHRYVCMPARSHTFTQSLSHSHTQPTHQPNQPVTESLM